MERTKNQKKFLGFKIIAFEPGSTNCHNPEQDPCHWQSICYQATVRFKMSLKEVYAKAGSLRLMKYIMEVLSSGFYKPLGPFSMFTVKGCSETVFFRERCNQVIESM